MSFDDPNNNRPQPVSGDAGGGWILGIIVVVLVGLGIWWWAGTGGAVTYTADTQPPPSASTTGTAPTSGRPATPPAAPSGTAR